LVSVIFGQWPNSVDDHLNIGYGRNLFLESDSLGNTFYIWTDSPWGYVHLQKLDHQGYIVWSDQMVGGGISAGGQESDSSWQVIEHDQNVLFPDQQGGVYIHFTEYFCILDCYEMYPVIQSRGIVQHIDEYGNKLWGNGVYIEDFYSNPSWSSSIALIKGTEDRLFILYSFSELSNTFFTTKFNIIDENGNLLLGDTGRVVFPEDYLSVVASGDSQGGYIIMSESKMKRFDTNGIIVWQDTIAQPYFFPYPFIRVSNNSFVIPVGHYVGNGIVILKLHKYNLMTGLSEWDSAGIFVDTVDYNFSDLIIDEMNNSWVAWNNNNGSKFQKFSESGEQIFQNGGGSPSISNEIPRNLKLNKDSNSNIIFTWFDTRVDSPGTYFQKINGDGDFIFSSDRYISDINIPFSDEDNLPDFGIVIGWEDSNYPYNIYTKYINQNGELYYNGVDNEQTIFPQKFLLLSAYPNPFNSSTTIQYDVSMNASLDILIFDIKGQEVFSISGYYPKGINHIEWRPKSLSSGIYLINLVSENLNVSNKIILLK